ncbi:MAG: PSD1 and planctomycete cytochrome C domain-containing protein [Fuerstiella sp.]|nr:PSD1 and planctomycete cytochrome C domain-containing protein [Fuerstiella sp.]
MRHVCRTSVRFGLQAAANQLYLSVNLMFPSWRSNLRLLTFGITLVVADPARPDQPSEELTFEEHVRPIFKAHCFQCHGEEPELSGDLDVRLVRLMRAGGESGPVIVPGQPNDSLLWQYIDSDEMPQGSKKLTTAQKDSIRRWLEQGAKTARPEPENVEDARFTNEELSHWAWQPITERPVPNADNFDIRTPIDAFVAKRLAEHQLNFSPQADKHTLIRRVSFSLLGLPPTPTDVEEFLADESSDSWEVLVGKLLDSPQFGVRWGRHWLDVAGYSETNGDPNKDTQRPHAWRYRDYVIDSFNSNKPIDQFYVEQLAGDELIDGDIDIHNPRHLELLTATGFLRMAPDTTQSSNGIANRNMAVAESLKVVSSSMLGLTVGCAQCHDHKYDPIGTDDYYRFRAVFDPVFPLNNWQQPSGRLVDFTTDETRAEWERIEAECKSLQEELNKRKKTHATTIFEQKIADVPEADRMATLNAVETTPGQRTPEQNKLLDLYPMVKTIDFIAGYLVEYDIAFHRECQKEAAKISELRATKPPGQLVMATQEQPNVVPVSTIFHRGNPQSPGEEVTPAEVMVLHRGRDVQLPVNDEQHSGTGRRLAWARQLTDGTHPLAARVFVNRVWMHHFGRGLVATPGDFGISGERPTHPELLDWLANDFVRNGWDHKRLHRMILLSRTWQQLSTRSAHQDQLDPENSLLGRMSLRRLEAEEIRDAVLSIVERLDQQLGGPSLPVTEDREGKVVIGQPQKQDGIKAGEDLARRSVYVQVHRKLPLNVLVTFDQPEMTPNCDLRRATTVATQSLYFLNDAELISRSEDLARLLVDRHKDDQSRLAELFVRLFVKPPTDTELDYCANFLSNQTRQFEILPSGKDQAEPPNPELRSLATLCQTLFGSNRFLYVD